MQRLRVMGRSQVIKFKFHLRGIRWNSRCSYSQTSLLHILKDTGRFYLCFFLCGIFSTNQVKTPSHGIVSVVISCFKSTPLAFVAILQKKTWQVSQKTSVQIVINCLLVKLPWQTALKSCWHSNESDIIKWMTLIKIKSSQIPLCKHDMSLNLFPLYKQTFCLRRLCNKDWLITRQSRTWNILITHKVQRSFLFTSETSQEISPWICCCC